MKSQVIECVKCHEEKPKTDFSKQKLNKSGRSGTCKLLSAAIRYVAGY